MSDGGLVSQTREGVSASETIGRLARVRGWLRRPRVIIPVAMVAMVLVLVSVGVRYLLDDGMSGPYGPFPRPVAAEAPARPPQPVATSVEGPGGLQIYGGVAIGGFSLRDTHAGVRAVSIATGNTYWQYDKQKPAEPIGLDHATGDVYVDGNHDLAKINVRTGRILWSRPTPGYFPNEHAIVSGTGTRTLAIFDDDPERGGGEVTGIDPVTGRTRWTRDLGCRWADGVTAAVGGTLVSTCGTADHFVHGIELATGEQLWHEDLARVKPHTDYYDYDFSVLDAGQGRVAVTTNGGFDLLDATTGKILRHRVTKGEIPVAFSGDVWLSRCALGETQGVCANDTDIGKRLWSSPFPGHQARYSTSDRGSSAYAAVANGRVYSNSATESDQIVVFDLRTGKPLTYWSPDQMSLRNGITVADGVVVVRAGGLGSDVALYADRPDLHGTRHLFFQ